MRLKTNVFLWVFLSTAAPLTALTLFATGYSEHRYQRDVHQQVDGSLGSIVSEVGRRLLLEREILEALAGVPAVRAYLPVLAAAAAGKRHPEFTARSNQLNEFLEAFQSMFPGSAPTRVLDVRGNTLVKVEGGRRTEAAYEGIEAFPYAENELEDEAFVRFLAELQPGQMSSGFLPRRGAAAPDRRTHALLDMVLAVGDGERVLGFLTTTARAEPIDRLLQVMPRPHDGELLIAEINFDEPVRDGLILYDEQTGRTMAGGHEDAGRLPERYPGLYAAIQGESYGHFDSVDGRTRYYFREYLPYPDRLTTWIVALRVDLATLAAPFQRIRFGILAAFVVALLLSLLPAHFGSRRIARPITELAARLGAYARGERALPVKPRGPDETRAAGEAFNTMARALEQAETERDRAERAMLQSAKLASIGQMAAGIGHEINNPLNNILSLTKLVERGLPAGERQLRQDIAGVREEALRASRIVRGVLSFARQVPPHYTRFDLAAWLHETLGLVEPQAREHGVGLHGDPGPGGEIEGDRDLLQQVLINLLMNAVQASPAGSVVSAQLGRAAGQVLVTVLDEGPGIAEHVAEQAFDPFFTTKPVGKGTGLGLSISLGIVERHGGTLSIANRAGGGVRAVMCLPTEPVPEASGARAAERTEGP